MGLLLTIGVWKLSLERAFEVWRISKVQETRREKWIKAQRERLLLPDFGLLGKRDSISLTLMHFTFIGYPHWEKFSTNFKQNPLHFAIQGDSKVELTVKKFVDIEVLTSSAICCHSQLFVGVLSNLSSLFFFNLLSSFLCLLKREWMNCEYSWWIRTYFTLSGNKDIKGIWRDDNKDNKER